MCCQENDKRIKEPLKIADARYRKPYNKEMRQENRYLCLGLFLSFMIHGVVVAGLFCILFWSEQDVDRPQVVLLLNSDGAPPEKLDHPSIERAAQQKLPQRVQQVRPIKPLPTKTNVSCAEPPRTATEATERSEPAVPTKAIFEEMAESRSSILEETVENRENGLSAGRDGFRQGAEDKKALARGYLADHFTYLRELILKRLKYPPEARKKGHMGRVKVSFMILESGAVTGLGVVASSGHRLLDENVLQTIRDLGKLPKPPVEVQIVLPISFSLD